MKQKKNIISTENEYIYCYRFENRKKIKEKVKNKDNMTKPKKEIGFIMLSFGVL